MQSSDIQSSSQDEDTLRRVPAINLQRDNDLSFMAETLPRVKATQNVEPRVAGKVARNFIVQSLGQLYGYVSALVAQNIIATLLLENTYGAYSTVTVYISLFAVLADGGIMFISVREAAKYPEKIEKILSNTFWLKTIFAGVAFSLSIAIVYLFIPYPADVRFGIFIFAISQFFTSISVAFDVIFQSRQQSRYPTIVVVTARNIIFFGLLAALLYQTKFTIGPHLDQRMLFYYLIILNIILNIVSFFIKFIGGIRQVPLRFSIDWTYARSLLIISIPMGIVTILGQIHYKADILILSVLASKTDVGIYNMAYRGIEFTLMFLTLLTSMLFPVLANYSTRNITAFRNATRRVVDICVTIVVPICVIVALLAPGVVALYSNNHYPLSATPLAILTISLIFSFINNIYSYLVIVENQQNQLIWVQIINIIANVSLNLYAIPRYSYNGSAVATIITEGLGMFLTIYVANRILRIYPSIPSIMRSLIATGATAAVIIIGLHAIPNYIDVRLSAMALGGVGAGVYALVLLVIGGVDPAIIRTVGKRVPILRRIAGSLGRTSARTEKRPADVRISVVIPTYNRAHLIGDAIRSILDQTVTPHEIIVVDDGSTDATEAVMRGFGNVIYHRQENGGVERARTTGGDLATGDYIYFLDSDDMAEPIALERLGAQARRYPNCGMIYGQALVRDEEHHIERIYKPSYRRHAGLLGGLREASHLVTGNYIQLGGSTLISQAAWKTAGGFDVSFGGFLEDWDLLIRLCKITKVCYVPEILVEIRHTPGSLISRMNGERQRTNQHHILDRLQGDPVAWKRIARWTRKKILASQAMTDASLYFYIDKNYTAARKSMRLAFRSHALVMFIGRSHPWTVLRMWVYLRVPGLLKRRTG
jgi:O-antigen/teichoic acid export membrane protein/glycosyltransferase involved in cell wall biosynthesis